MIRLTLSAVCAVVGFFLMCGFMVGNIEAFFAGLFLLWGAVWLLDGAQS